VAARAGAGPDLVKSRVGRALQVLAVIALLAATVWWWDLTGPAPMAQALYLVVPAAALAVAGLAALLRARRAVLIALIALLVSAVAMVPVLRPAPQRPADGPELTVLALNVQYGMADVASIATIVAQRRIDVLVLTEADQRFVARLSGRTGIRAELPYDSGRSLPESAGTAVLSRLPMTVLQRDDHADHEDDPTKPQQPIVRLDVAGHPVTLRGVHPRSPTSEAKLPAWRSDLAALARWRQETTGPLIVAGDFNSGWPHPAFRELAAGMDDALRVTGQAWTPTWPSSRRLPAFTQIDHVLSSGFQVVDAGTVAVPRTDHLGVWARLRLR